MAARTGYAKRKGIEICLDITFFWNIFKNLTFLAVQRIK